MGNVKVSALPVASTVLPADSLYVIQGGVSKQSPITNLWEATPVGNANYNILATDVQVFTSVAFTGPHTWFLPSAASYGAGRILRIVDAIGTLTSVNALTISRSGSDTITGGLTTQVLSQAGQSVLMCCDGNSIWSVLGFGISAFGNSYQAVSISAAGNTNSTQGACATHFMNVTVGAGAGGTYTGTISLPHTNIAPGDVNSIYLNIAASTNPKIQIFDNTTAGTLLLEWQNDGQQSNLVAVCVYNGSAFYLHDAHFI